MRLDAWLKQPHAFNERMRLIERLAQELNTVHDRGESLAAIAPENVEVGSDQKVDLRPAGRGRAEPGYAAPERLEGGPSSAAADIYSVGALCWEILIGRPCGESPKPLLDVSPDLPRELANSVMGCLERSPEWRPKDLTYLAQLAAAQQTAVRAPEPAAKPKTARAAQPPRSSASPARSAGGGATRPSTRRASRSHLPLVIAAVLLVAAAASSYLWINREQAQPSTSARAAVPVATPMPTPTPDVAATPTPAATAAPAPEPTVAPTPTPTPDTVMATPEPTPPPTPAPTPTPAPVREPTPAPAPVVSEPVVPATLSAVSPLVVKRPGKVLLDIRGTGLRSDQRVRVLPMKETPHGISVVRQKWVDAGLVTVLLDLDAKVTPAVYAIALESPDGSLSNPLQLTISK